MFRDYNQESTTFRESDVDNTNRLDGFESKRNHYHRLRKTNTLRWNGGWRDEKGETERDLLAVVDSLANQLSLTPYQKERARHIASSVNDDFRLGYASAMLAFCACGLAGVSDNRPYHPNTLRVDDDTRLSKAAREYRQLADELNLSYQRVFSCWNRMEADLQ